MSVKTGASTAAAGTSRYVAATGGRGCGRIRRRGVALAGAALAVAALTLAPVAASGAGAPAGSAWPAGLAGAASPMDRYAAPPLRSSSAALLDVTANRWLLLDAADAPHAQASTTKMMTALVALTYGRLDDLVTVDAAAAALGQQTGSAMGLVAGEQASLRDLLYGLLLPSGNDAALAIAAHVGGSVTAFVTLMNREAAQLGLTHTHFVNPHGLDAPGQYASARDLVLLARVAMGNPIFRRIVATPSYAIPATATHPAHVLTNVNWFVRWYPGADGVKPGMTGDAGLCQVVSARRNGHWLIGALMNTPDLYTDVRDLMNYGFGDFRWSPSGQPGDDPRAAVHVATPDAPALYFPATGHRVRAGFLDYFTRHGGTAILGLPRTDEFTEDGLTVQYFAHARLWWDAAAGVAMATPLGQQAVPSPALTQPVAPLAPAAPVSTTALTTPASASTAESTSASASASTAVLYVAATGHTVRGAILAAYRAGGGIDTFGLPLTEEIQTGALTEQYFSNAVLRWAPGRPVVLAPLGDEALRRRGYAR